MSEILRKLADVMDQQPQVSEPVATDHVDTNSELTPVPTDVMLPPLQGKYELLKRAVGVQNKFDEGNADPEDSNYKITPMEADEQSALDRMKKNAGVSAFITHELADDEPLEG